jgi:hypothetical protein
MMRRWINLFPKLIKPRNKVLRPPKVLNITWYLPNEDFLVFYRIALKKGQFNYIALSLLIFGLVPLVTRNN